jgi:hypothetical protein
MRAALKVFITIVNALAESIYNRIGIFCLKPNSSNSLAIQIAVKLVSVKFVNSAFVLLSTVNNCFFNF